MSFVPHPSHATIVAGEMVLVTLRARSRPQGRARGPRDRALRELRLAPDEADRSREEMIDGKNWIVMERELAIVPKRAGLLHCSGRRRIA